jgi:hypothetical protein
MLLSKYLIFTYLDLGAAGKVAEEKGTTLAVPSSKLI